MPTYEYRCANCGHELEAVQSFSDPALTECPQCGEPALRKLFGNVGVVFKGSGFYRNDSRNEGKGKTSSSGTKTADPAAKSDTSTSSNAKSPEGGSGSAAAKPAADSSAKTSGGSTAPAASKSTT